MTSQLSQFSTGSVLNYTGDEEDGCFDGEGTAQLHGGHTYQGSFKNGNLSGNGSYRWNNEVLYSGQFADNRMRGFGAYDYNNGVTFDGQVWDGIRHGQGTLIISQNKDYREYKGDWLSGIREGVGILYYNKERTSYYKGEWKNGMRHGNGRMVYESGSIYDGQWIEDKKCGDGKMIWKGLNQMYIGSWNNDIPNGKGSHYIGTSKVSFENGAIDTLYLSTINWYNGNFENGQRHGFGTYYYASGARYDGEWQRNKKHGSGQYIREDGFKYVGTFENDNCPDCKGILLLSPTFQIDISDLISNKTERNNGVAPEKAEIQKLFLRYLKHIRKIYNVYKGKPNPVLTLGQVWALMERCQQLNNSDDATQPNFGAINRSIWFGIMRDHPNDVTNISDQSQPILKRQFVESLIRIAVTFGQQSSDESIAQKFQRFMRDFIQPLTQNKDTSVSIWNHFQPSIIEQWSSETRALFEEQLTVYLGSLSIEPQTRNVSENYTETYTTVQQIIDTILASKLISESETTEFTAFVLPLFNDIYHHRTPQINTPNQQNTAENDPNTDAEPSDNSNTTPATHSHSNDSSAEADANAATESNENENENQSTENEIENNTDPITEILRFELYKHEIKLFVTVICMAYNAWHTYHQKITEIEELRETKAEESKKGKKGKKPAKNAEPEEEDQDELETPVLQLCEITPENVATFFAILNGECDEIQQ